MENLHLKNLKTDFETSLPTNQNYLNSIFKQKNFPKWKVLILEWRAVLFTIWTFFHSFLPANSYNICIEGHLQY